MTLANIFFGKKVVQQAYLKDALIYQSKGWETLPSTYYEVWTKKLPIPNFAYYSLCTDMQNNLIAFTGYPNGGDASVTKISSDGTLLWSSTLGVPTSRGYQMHVDLYNNIYCVTSYTEGNGITTNRLHKIDSKGKVTTSTIAVASPIQAIAYDDYYIYIGFLTSSYNYCLLKKYTYSGVLQLEKEYGWQYVYAIATNTNSNYIYIHNGSAIFKINKSDFSATAIDAPISRGTNMIMDSLGDLYYYATNSQFITDKICKYSPVTGATNTIPIYSTDDASHRPNIQSICTDNQNNLYVTGYFYGNNTSGNGALYTQIVKYSPNGTWQWNYVYPYTDSSFTYSSITLATDNNNNPYIMYYNAGTTITKLLNLVKS